MARTITALMALVALLALSACNNVTGPATGSTQGEIGDGGDRGPDVFDSPKDSDTVGPDPGDNGGSGSVTHPLNRIRFDRRARSRESEVVAPVDGEGGGGGEAPEDNANQPSRRRGSGTVSPAN